MKTILEELKSKIGKPYHDLEFLLLCLKSVLEENGETEIAKDIPFINQIPFKNGREMSAKDVQLYSLVFQLVNMTEVNAAVQNRRAIENEKALYDVKGLFAINIKELSENGLSEDDLIEGLIDTNVEPVLTAHPTEAKRTTVLDHHRELYLMLVSMENKMYSQNELLNIRHNIKLTLYRLWKTGEIYLEKPDVKSELRNVMHYLVNVFPEVIPVLDRRLIQAWIACNLDKNKLLENHAFPKITFGNWVGGDRDGHPLVTDTVTSFTLDNLRLNAFVVLNRKMTNLVKHLSLTCELEECSREFNERINRMVSDLDQVGSDSLSRNKGESFRQFVNLMIVKLPIVVERGHPTQLSPSAGRYILTEELLEDLNLLKTELIRFGAMSVAYNDVNLVIRCVQIFGFHLAKLDIRQNSTFHDKAIEQLLTAAQFDEVNFSEWKEEKRVKFLTNELKSNRPFTHQNSTLGVNADAVISCYKVIEEQASKYGLEGVGSFIVSMTRSLSDLLVVYLLAREAGLIELYNKGLICKIPVVPLFETIEDLENGPDILNQFLSHDFTKRSLLYLQQRDKKSRLSQQVMVGYSDSNKDGGIIASQWNLYKAQFKLSEIGAQHNVDLTFFHGKGGSISRGSGPTRYFIKALPYDSIRGNIRLTEQGETIAQKYENIVNAEYNLELLVANTLSKRIQDEKEKKQFHGQADILNFLSKSSQEHFKKLTHESGFIEYFRQATPIDAIETSKIGSRPAKRTGASSLKDLRAIPWVFSWSQARFHMTSWYGVGTALTKLRNEQPDKYEVLKIAIKTDPFIRYVLTNVDTSLAATDEKMMQLYSSLVEDPGIKDKFLNLFLEELSRTREMLFDLIEDHMEFRRKNHYYSNYLRAPLMKHLHEKQVQLLSDWRNAKKINSKNQIEIQRELMLTINAIASAMRNTG